MKRPARESPRRKRLCQRVRQGPQRALGRRIRVHAIGAARDVCGGQDIDDDAPAASDHPGSQQLAQKQRRAIVQSEDAIQVRRIKLGPVHALDDMTSIVDENVDGRIGLRFGRHALHIVIDGQVCLDHVRFPPSDAYFVSERMEAIEISVAV